MIRLLLIAEHAHTAEALQVLLSPQRYRCIHLPPADPGEDGFPAALADACILDTDLADIGGQRRIAAARAQFPGRPLFVCAENIQREWEEDAYLQGVAFVFRKPLRAPLLAAVLERFLPAPAAPAAPETAPATGAPGAAASAPVLATLETIRDFSRLLSHSLNFKSFLQEYVLKLREVISVNRIAVFLRPPQTPFLPAKAGDSRRLVCACSVGVAANLYQFFELSLEAGIGAALVRHGQILRAGGDTRSPFAPDGEAQREFEILGCQIAIPILDRERLLGAAVFGGRLTGLRLSDEELQLLFHLMEELALAIKNSRLHDQLAASHDLISGVMSQMSGGCLVVSRDLTLLQANPACRRLLDLPSAANRRLEFSDLPQKIASAVYETLRGAAPESSFHYHAGGRVLRVSLAPFRLADAAAPSAALAAIEDHTQIEAAKKSEIERENRRLITLIAEKFAHEIRNALVPINTHRQLLPTEFAREEFRASLRQTLDQETLRILRCADQLTFLARDKNQPIENHSLLHLLQQAAAKAAGFVPEKAAVDIAAGTPDCQIFCEPASLRHALCEVILNALQARPESPAATVKGRLDQVEGRPRLVLGIRDPGPGFTAAAAATAFQPFFTTRNVGIGLGLTVARKIIRDHDGDMTIFPRPHTAPGDIVITLPAS